jgi:hypothetical protein
VPPESHPDWHSGSDVRGKRNRHIGRNFFGWDEVVIVFLIGLKVQVVVVWLLHCRLSHFLCGRSLFSGGRVLGCLFL